MRRRGFLNQSKFHNDRRAPRLMGSDLAAAGTHQLFGGVRWMSL
jgi:hypothetical protein